MEVTEGSAMFQRDSSIPFLVVLPNFHGLANGGRCSRSGNCLGELLIHEYKEAMEITPLENNGW